MAETTSLAPLPVTPAPVQHVNLAGAHRLEILSNGDRQELRITDRRGNLDVAITIAGDTITLHVQRANLAIRAEQRLEVSAEHLHLHARAGMTLGSGGDMAMEAAGDITTSGRIQTIQARQGNVNVEANDDIRLEGERIRLNC